MSNCPGAVIAIKLISWVAHRCSNRTGITLVILRILRQKLGRLISVLGLSGDLAALVAADHYVAGGVFGHLVMVKGLVVFFVIFIIIPWLLVQIFLELQAIDENFVLLWSFLYFRLVSLLLIYLLVYHYVLIDLFEEVRIDLER